MTQCKHSKGGVDVKLTKFNTRKNIIKCAQNIRCTCSTCEQSQPTKFEYEGMKTDGSFRLLKPDTPWAKNVPATGSYVLYGLI